MARHLKRQGWRLIAERLRTARGELDLVFEAPGVGIADEPDTAVFGERIFAERCSRPGTLVVVEVKTRRLRPDPAPGSLRWRPADAVGPTRRRGLELAAARLASSWGLRSFRVVVAEVWTYPGGRGPWAEVDVVLVGPGGQIVHPNPRPPAPEQDGKSFPWE